LSSFSTFALFLLRKSKSEASQRQEFRLFLKEINFEVLLLLLLLLQLQLQLAYACSCSCSSYAKARAGVSQPSKDLYFLEILM
jgi:hypothetical protein